MEQPIVDPAVTSPNIETPPALPPSSGEAVAPGLEVPQPPGQEATPAPDEGTPAPDEGTPSPEEGRAAEEPVSEGEIGAEFEPEAGIVSDIWRAIRSRTMKPTAPLARGRVKPKTWAQSLEQALKEGKKPVTPKGETVEPKSTVAKDYLENMEFILPTEKRIKIRMPTFDSENSITNLLNTQAEYYRTLLDDAKRGVITDVDLRQKAHRIISDLSISKWKQGQMGNAEQQFAAREVLAELGGEFVRFKNKMVQQGVWDLDETREQALRMLNIIWDLNKRVYAESSETGRALRVPQVEVKGLGKAGQIADIAQALNEASALTDAHVTIDQLFDSLKALKTGDEMTALGSAWSTGKGLFYEYWLNAMLSGPVTMTGNLMGNTIGLGNAVLERYLAAGWGSVLRGDTRVLWREGNAMVSEIYDSLGDAWRSASRVYHETEVSQFSKLDTISRGAWSVENLGDSMFGRFFDTLGYYIIRQPTRILQGSDQFFKFLAFRASLRAESERLASMQGLRGLEFNREVNRIMTSPEVFESVHANAENFASYVTYTQDLGKAGMKLMAARDALGPLGQIAFPFIKTPVNVMKHIGERLPLVNLFGEPASRLITGSSTALYKDFMAGGVQRNMALAKITTGMAAAAMVWYWASQGMITGMGSRDKKQVDALVPTGWKEYSIYIQGYGYLGYNRTDPLGGFISTIASITQLAQGKHLAWEEIDDLAMSALVAYSDTFISRSFVMGFSRLADVVTAMRRGEMEGSMQKFASQTIGSVVPNFFAQFNRAFLDNRQTEMDGLLDRAASRIPLFSKGNRAVRNIWGEEVHYATFPGVLGFILPFDFSKEEDDPEAKEIYRLGVRVPEIPSVLFGKRQPSVILDPRRQGEDFNAYGENLTPPMQDRYAYLRGSLRYEGKTLREKVRSIINSPEYKSRERTDGPQGSRAAEIGAAFNTYQNLAEQKVIKEFDLEKRRQEVHEKRGQLKIGTPQGDYTDEIIKRFGGGR